MKYLQWSTMDLEHAIKCLSTELKDGIGMSWESGGGSGDALVLDRAKVVITPVLYRVLLF
jgi:hypothetical protein